MRLCLALLVLAACVRDDDGRSPLLLDAAWPDTFIACPRHRTGVCNPLTHSGCAIGEKCTWIVDAFVPEYFGHVGCVPIGSANVGESCTFGPAGCGGFDNCATGLVCGDFRGGVGTCKKVCNQKGGMPTCDDTHACVTYPDLFRTGDTTAPAAGVCLPP